MLLLFQMIVIWTSMCYLQFFTSFESILSEPMAFSGFSEFIILFLLAWLAFGKSNVSVCL